MSLNLHFGGSQLSKAQGIGVLAHIHIGILVCNHRARGLAIFALHSTHLKAVTTWYVWYRHHDKFLHLKSSCLDPTAWLPIHTYPHWLCVVILTLLVYLKWLFTLFHSHLPLNIFVEIIRTTGIDQRHIYWIPGAWHEATQIYGTLQG